jgi:hypothetical protein
MPRSVIRIFMYSLTHSLTHGAVPFLRSCQLCNYSRTSQDFMEPEGSLPCSQEPSTGPYSEPDQPNPYIHFLSLRSLSKVSVQVRGFLNTFVTRLFFYGEELLAPHPTPKLDDHPLSTANAYSIYSQLPSIPRGRLLHPQPQDAPCRGDKGPT